MGRPWPQAGESLFTDEDTAEILEYLDDERLTCPGCGEPRVRSFDPENEFAYRATPLACHACAAKERVARKVDVRDGLHVAVEFLGD